MSDIESMKILHNKNNKIKFSSESIKRMNGIIKVNQIKNPQKFYVSFSFQAAFIYHNINNFFFF